MERDVQKVPKGNNLLEKINNREEDVYAGLICVELC